MLLNNLNFVVNLNFLVFFIVTYLFICIYGLISYSKNFIHFMVFLELLYLNFSFSFVVFSKILGTCSGETLSVLIISIAAAEAAIGFSLLILVLNKRVSLFLKTLHYFN